MKEFFSEDNLGILFKQYKFSFAASFSLGVLISSTFFAYKLVMIYKTEKLIQRERQLEIEKKEKECKKENTDYAKFMNLGFPDTANQKFNMCMKEK